MFTAQNHHDGETMVEQCWLTDTRGRSRGPAL